MVSTNRRSSIEIRRTPDYIVFYLYLAASYAVFGRLERRRLRPVCLRSNPKLYVDGL